MVLYGVRSGVFIWGCRYVVGFGIFFSIGGLFGGFRRCDKDFGC